MAPRERTYFELTLKGSEELATRTYRLDAKIRNILFLIQRGFATTEGILENSIFPRDEVVERLRDLLRGHFITLHAPTNGTAAATTVTRAPDTAGGPAQTPAEAEPDSEPDEPPPPV
jgi:hypothetical protein